MNTSIQLANAERREMPRPTEAEGKPSVPENFLDVARILADVFERKDVA